MHPDAIALIKSLVPLKWIEETPSEGGKRTKSPNAKFDNYFQWTKTSPEIYAAIEEMFTVNKRVKLQQIYCTDLISTAQAFDVNKAVITGANVHAAFPHSAVLQPLQGLIKSDPDNLVRFAKAISANAGNGPDDLENMVCKTRPKIIMCPCCCC